MSSQGGRVWGQKLPIFPSKKTTKRGGGGGGGQKSPILRRHSLWTAPYILSPIDNVNSINFSMESCMDSLKKKR